jgi:hypothetical protein
MWIELLEICRWGTFLLGVVNLMWLLVRVSMHWEEYSSGIERGMSITLILFVLAATYGSAEGIIRELTVGSRSLIIVVAQISLTVLLWASRGRTLFNLSGSKVQK